MDVFFQSLVSLAILFLSLSFFFILKQRNSKQLPPGSSGWPVLGENLQFALSGPWKFMSDRMKKHSSQVFKTSLLGTKMAVFCGPAGNKFLFSNEKNLLTPWWPVSMKKALVFPSFADKTTIVEINALLHSFLHELLKPEALKHYIPVIDTMAREHLKTDWIPFKEVKVYPLSKKYAFANACRLFMNVTDERVQKLADTFAVIMSGFLSLPIDFPGTSYNKALKGGKMARDELLKIIRARKKEILCGENIKENEADHDYLSRMLLKRDENGEFIIGEMEISNNLVGLLMANYDTTSTGITFIFKYLSELPHVYEKVYKEQMEVLKSKDPKELLNWKDIQKMKYSWNVACEALRLAPPAPGATREVIVDFTFAGFTIPKGWKTFWSVHSTHKNPEYFPNPEKFDPSRFEGSGPVPYTFVPFGGGPRMCPGKEFARLLILVFMHNVVTRFKFERSIPDEKIIDNATPIPVNGLPIRLQPNEIY